MNDKKWPVSERSVAKLRFSISILLTVAMALCALIRDGGLRIAAIAVLGVANIFVIIFLLLRRELRRRSAARLVEREGIFDAYLNSSMIPTAVCSVSGKIFWTNSAFIKLSGRTCEGLDIFRLYPDLERPDKRKKIEISGKGYKKELIKTTFENDEYLIVRLVDLERSVRTTGAYRSLTMVACRISIDNYEGLTGRIPQVEVSALDSGIDRLVSDFAADLHALLLKFGSDKYLLCFEFKFLAAAQQDKFSLLDKVRALTTSEGLNPTLSVAVGAGGSPDESDDFSRKAMELARGRGGDQAVIKDADGYAFYGGVQRAVEVNSRVRSRTVAKALRNLMEQCETVLIMGHETADLDCLGAALGVAACARHLGKPTYIVLERVNAAISALTDRMHANPEYDRLIISPSEAHAIIDKHTLTVIVDTQIASYTADPGLLSSANTLVVIDHHLRGTTPIENASLFYHEPYASSTSEMVTELVQYFSEQLKLAPIEAESLLAGIMIDTKGFSFKTGVRTFEAAGYLRRIGANTTTIRPMFQDDYATYTAKADVVRSAELLPGGIAIASCAKELKNSKLIAAQAADELVSIRGINASFVLCEIPGGVSISGRSLGAVNVQLILEKLGGGGHATIAGAQIYNKSPREARELLLSVIKGKEGKRT